MPIEPTWKDRENAARANADPATVAALDAQPVPIIRLSTSADTSATGSTDLDWDDDSLAPDGFRVTDSGNAQRFINLTDGKVRYVHKWQKWIVYGGGVWSVDTGNALITEAAKVVARSLWEMVPNLRGNTRTQLVKAATKAESAGSITAMVQLARGIPGVLVAHDELDADPYLLNCANGTVDLRTGELRRHDPTDLCTQIAPVKFDPDAEAPLWDACLARWQPDPEVREYLQREAGAGACGRQTETLSVHYGQGGNGKSKFWEAVSRSLGSYAVVPHKSLIVATKHDQHATVLASLFRARLAVTSETSDRDWLDEAQVKNLTGGDMLAARRMREDEWTFAPSHTLVMFSNHRPAIRGTDEGIWRRVRLIDWNVTIPAAERDEALGEKLAKEASGILRWIVAGTVRFLAEGIQPPASIAAATTDYRHGQDTVTRFLSEVGIVFDPRSQVASNKLLPMHDSWCSDAGMLTGETAGHWKRVAAELVRRGAKKQRVHGGARWSGIRLSEPVLDASVSGVTPLPVNSREDVFLGIYGTPDTPDTLSEFSQFSDLSAKTESATDPAQNGSNVDRDGCPIDDSLFTVEEWSE